PGCCGAGRPRSRRGYPGRAARGRREVSWSGPREAGGDPWPALPVRIGESGHPGEANMPKRALVLIDIQNDYFPGGRWALSGIEAAADNAARMLAAARAAGDLVVHVRHEFPTADAPFFAPGSDGAKIHPKVRNLEGEPVVLKHHVNSFRETDLKAILDRHGVEEVVICGEMSHMCVDAGTRAASDLGYRCVVRH